MSRTGTAMRLLGMAIALLLWVPAGAQAQDVCNAQFNIDYTSGPGFGVAGDDYTVEVGIGTGSISGGANNQITIDQWRFELDCANNPFIGCVDEGAIVSYRGDATISVGGTGCVDINGAPVGFSSNNAGGGTAPNQLVFTPSAPVVLDANVDSTSDAACKVSFGIQIATSPGTDATPFLVQESAGFTAVPPFDAMCDQPNPIPGTAAQSGQIPLCQLCDDGNACTTESCNQETNVCETTFTQICDDGNACTTEACNTATGACETSFTQTCDDGDACTTESCNTASGACETTFTQVCDDGNACTTEACNTATGACETSFTQTCDDGNACTTEACNTATGACETSFTQTCDDGNACTTEACNTANGQCETSFTQTCDDGDACTTEACNTANGQCETSFTQTCDDGDACTTEACNTANGQCETSFTQTCDDGDACTTEACNTATGQCETSFTQTCDDGNACTTEACNTATGQCETSFTQTCDDGNACTTEACNTATGQCETSFTQVCDDGNACTTEACNTATGACETSFTQTCDDQDACTTEACNTATGACDTTSTVTCEDPTCEECNPATGTCEDQDPLPVACAPVGCRITAGGITPDGVTEPGDLALMNGKVTFGGQVGAPCGCIDCFDTFGNIEGEWQHNRHKRKGRIHTSLYRSLICQLDDGEGPEPRPAPANRACWTGLGRMAMSAARNDPRTEPVIIRMDVEDRGEPGGGQNAGDPDLYRFRAWDPSGLSDQEVEELFAGICCKTYFEPDSIQPPSGSVLLVDDGGEPGIVHGNIQIHPVLPNTEKGICPPRQSCFE